MNKLSAMDDHALVQLYENGTDQAFDIILSRHGNSVYSYILFLVKNQEDADDIFQETFARAITSIRDHRYQTTGDFGAWLIRIAHNLSIDHTRRSSSAMQKRFTQAVIEDATYMEEGQERTIIDQQNNSTLQKMLSYLPEAQQEIVYMRYYQDLSFREISQKKGISINTALGRMRYAIINLRKMVKQHEISLVG